MTPLRRHWTHGTQDKAGCRQCVTTSRSDCCTLMLRAMCRSCPRRGSLCILLSGLLCAFASKQSLHWRSATCCWVNQLAWRMSCRRVSHGPAEPPPFHCTPSGSARTSPCVVIALACTLHRWGARSARHLPLAHSPSSHRSPRQPCRPPPLALLRQLPSPPAAAQPLPSPTDKQLSFWQRSLEEHGHSLLQTMLLHTDEGEAAQMNEGELEEIFNMCKIQKHWRVCEWAAGMGRITPLLAHQARFVYASDFVAEFCQTNAARCRELGVKNVQIDCIDAATYDPQPDKAPPHQTDFFELVFVNWLLLYLDDVHAEKFLRAAKASLKQRLEEDPAHSGWIFLHESCWERPNESELFAALPKEEQTKLLALPCEKTEDCQTYYRKVYWYRHLFERVGLECTQQAELSVYAPATTFSADGSEVASGSAADATGEATATEEESEGGYYNRQMCWMLRIKQ